jgi:nitrile hydratase beta subunit
MNGIHDMGGLHGFGRVEVEPDEPVFHERWEARVFGMVQSLGRGNIDAGRHSIERLDPVAYLENGYYGRWFAALERALLASGVLTPAEIERRLGAGPPPPRKPGGPPAPWQPQAVSYLRVVDSEPAFAPGDAVRTRNHQPSGHTRLPAYARCRQGIVLRVHPAMVFPDDHAHDRGENPQFLYTVRFESRELWGDGAEVNSVVHLDLFESYLQSA